MPSLKNSETHLVNGIWIEWREDRGKGLIDGKCDDEHFIIRLETLPTGNSARATYVTIDKLMCRFEHKRIV